MAERLFMLQHVPGPMVGLVQECTRCGELLSDYRNSMVALNPDGSMPRLTGWAEGKPMLRTPGGGYAELFEGDNSNIDWTFCKRQSASHD